MRHLKYISLLALCISAYYQNLNAQPIFSWGKCFGSIKNEYSSSIKADNNGNIFITGTFESPTISFGSIILHHKVNGNKDIFLTKIGSNDSVKWAKSAGAKNTKVSCSNSDNYVNCITIDNSGNCYIAGMFTSDTISFSSTIYLAKGCNNYDANIFIAKYDSSGQVLWAKQFGSSNWDKATGICTDNSGNVVVTGYFWSDNINFGGVILANKSSTTSFILKLNGNGNVVWAKGSYGTNATSVAIDNNNNILVGGNFQDISVSFGNQILTNTGMWDIFLVKYDANGNVLWARSATGEKSDDLNTVKIDNSNNIYISGRFISNHLIFGNLTPINNFSSGYSYDIFITKYDTNGIPIWAKSFGGDQEEIGLSLTIDFAGNILLSGLYESNSINFDSHTISKSGQRNVFLIKLDQNSNVIWAVTSTGSGYDNINCVTSDNNGNSYLFGAFSNNFSIGGYNFSSNGLSDVYLTKFNN